MPNDKLIPLGHISKAQGVRGEVLIKTYTQDAENIATYGALWDEAGKRQFKLKIVRITNKGVIARVEGISDRNGAEALKGAKLCIARDQLPEPDPDEWYYQDLIGLAVITPDGTKIGQVTAMHDFGAGDLMELRREGEKTTELITFDKTTVPRIDVKAKTLTLDLPVNVSAEPPADGATDTGASQEDRPIQDDKIASPDTNTDSGGVAFRNARPEDVTSIVALLANDRLGKTREDPDDTTAGGAYAKAFRDIAADPNNELIVAEVDSKVVGCLQLTFIPGLSFTGGLRAQIEGVRVEPDQRGNNIGGQMLDQAIARARSRGAIMVQLTANMERDDAHRFYEQHGFIATHAGFKLML